MQVERLRLAGFKSFVEPTELAIEPGLTGIVGPNGCGKSNLVEALRWVMGEASAKRLRGGEMDDVIFAGSGSRPARNLAEVALTIDNGSRDAPFAFNDSDDDRGGAAHRARRRLDLPDQRPRGAGARRPAVVRRRRDRAAFRRDGQPGADRRADRRQADRAPRLLLDEAAGTAGLHARRHEAELKLRAAEDNLARLDDVIATLEAQIETLKKQARQAQRYRRLGEQIRRTEALLLHARWRQAAGRGRASAPPSFAPPSASSPAATETALARERDARPKPRRRCRRCAWREAAAAAELQRLTTPARRSSRSSRRVVAARAEAERRLAQIAADLEREAAHLADAEAALAAWPRSARGLERAGAGPRRERRKRRRGARPPPRDLADGRDRRCSR